MASFLYFVLCGTLAALATLELKTRNRTPRIQLYITLLCSLVFCGAFALLVSAAQLETDQYRTLAAVAVLPLTGGILFAVSRVNRRLQEISPTAHR